MRYETAEAYLAAVVSGEEAPDRDRIAAAKAMLPYQKAKERAPARSPTLKQMSRDTERSLEQQQQEAWKKKSDAVRLRVVSNKRGN